MNRLADKVAVITGSGAGIGRAIANLFHQEGCRIVLADISGEQADVAALLDGTVPVHCDVSRSEDVQSACSAAEAAFGKIDIFIGNAGIGGSAKPIIEDDVENVERLLSVNTKGAWLAIHHAAPVMQRAGGGSIVLVSSMAGIYGHPGMSGYSASKAGVINLARSAARELGPDGVRVNAICPGATDTEKRRAFREANGLPLHQSPEELPAALGRLAQPSDVAYAALFLASDESAFVTGTVLPVSGGQFS